VALPSPGSSRDRRIIFSTKALRSFGDGMMSIALAQYAVAIGLSGFEAGVVASSALVGTSIMTWLVGRYVERVGGGGCSSARRC
jgi:MFS family permease